MINPFSIRTFLACLLAALTTATILSCSENHNSTITTSMRLQEAVDTIRNDLETRLGNTVPSLSVLIDGPSGTYFTSSASEGMGEIISRIYTYRSGSAKTCTDYLHDHIYGPDSRVPIAFHFPYFARDVTLPNPFCCGHIFNSGPAESALNCENNMSAHVAEGNGYGTMRMLNRYIRTLMKGQNVLSSSSVEVMKHDISPGDETYALGCLRVRNLGYGHNGAIEGYLSLMLYDPETDISVIVMMPYWDLSKGVTSFVECFNILQETGWAARQVLGYPGKPT